MIVVSVKRRGSSIVFIEVNGHSKYANKGSDIVCSSVSTAMYVSIGILDKSKVDYNFTSDEEIPMMRIEINDVNATSDIVMDNLLEVFESLASEYSKNVRINNK